MSLMNRSKSAPAPRPSVATSPGQAAVLEEINKAKEAVAEERATPQVQQEKKHAPVVVKAKTAPASTGVRLAVCVPCKDMLHSIFSHNLCGLLNYNHQKNIETRVFYNMGTLVCNQRASLVKMAQEWAATHILWLDSDTSFPFYTAFKLLSHNQALVAGNYPTRVLPYKTVAYKKEGDWESYIKHGNDIEPSKDLIQVEGIGMGCMLTSIEVFDAIGKPWFNIAYDERTDDYLGEDMDFCLRAREKGYKIYVDDILSRQISHLGTFAYTHDLVK